MLEFYFKILLFFFASMTDILVYLVKKLIDENFK